MVPDDWLEALRSNIEAVRGRIAAACDRTGRRPADVRLVAVTKYASLDVVRALLALGLTDLGESRVQQLVSRAEEPGASLAAWDEAQRGPSQSPTWHMIGHLQRNKVKTLLPRSRTLHSVDSQRLIEEIDKQAERFDAVVDVLLEVNVSGEASKQGAPIASVIALAESSVLSRHLRLRGLMTMAPAAPDPERARPHFARLRELLEDLRTRGVVGRSCGQLSMGMSQDYAVAVEEGATLVRIGSALYEGLAHGATFRVPIAPRTAD